MLTLFCGMPLFKYQLVTGCDLIHYRPEAKAPYISLNVATHPHQQYR